MTKLYPAKKFAFRLIILLLPAFILIVQGCKKKRPEIANVLFKKTHNKIFINASLDSFAAVFKKVLAEEKPRLIHADFITDHYEKNQYTPDFVMDHLFNHDLSEADDYFMDAGQHGLNAHMFDAKKIGRLISKLSSKNGEKNLGEAYRDMAELEIMAANSLINYTCDLQYGVINPKAIYQRYFLATKTPDSTSMSRVFHIANMCNYLDSIQPKDPQYLALQEALNSGYQAPGISAEETKRILIVNLERLRWRNKPGEDKYVIVNIPDYTLNVIDSGRSVLKMKVCVGGGRNINNANTLVAYNDTCKIDTPNEHETPLLNSVIYGVEVNPVWNIPRSIANKEIIVEEAKDRFYLSNNNIDVYKDGILVPNPENINWSKITKENLPYEFKQEPGADNSLGKIKFLFDNKSSVYLHDTPAKWVFSQKMRAVSHGCVRLGDPQGLALSVFGKGEKYDKIAKDMSEDNPAPTMIWLSKKVPLYITYVTCWADEKGLLQFRNDVYGLDIVLYDHLLRFTDPEIGKGPDMQNIAYRLAK